MATLNCQIAKIAHHRNISELDEVLSPITFAQEEGLTGVTPGLKIGWIRAILDEADDVILDLEEVSAYQRRRPIAVAAGYG